MLSSAGYILRTRPYTEASVIADLFTQDAGRITCIARPAKLRGKVQKGHLQSFRLLQLQWQGRSELTRLTQTDERYRHRIPASHLLFGLYLNELLLKLVQIHSPLTELFTTYQHTLQLLCDSEAPMVVVIQFEIALLDELGYLPDLWQVAADGDSVVANKAYVFGVEAGLQLSHPDNTHSLIPISGELLIAMRHLGSMELEHYQALRWFLDALWARLVRPLNSRKLLRF